MKQVLIKADPHMIKDLGLNPPLDFLSTDSLFWMKEEWALLDLRIGSEAIFLYDSMTQHASMAVVNYDVTFRLTWAYMSGVLNDRYEFEAYDKEIDRYINDLL